MKKLIQALLIGLIASSMAVPAFAAEAATPAEIYSELSGKSAEEAWTERHATDKTYGQLAEAAGFLEAFQEKVKALHEVRVKELLEAGKITPEQAQDILKDMEECDGQPGSHAGTHRLNYGNGIGQGEGQGFRRGGGLRDGNGFRGRWNTDND